MTEREIFELLAAAAIDRGYDGEQFALGRDRHLITAALLPDTPHRASLSMTPDVFTSVDDPAAFAAEVVGDLRTVTMASAIADES